LACYCPVEAVFYAKKDASLLVDYADIMKARTRSKVKRRSAARLVGDACHMDQAIIANVFISSGLNNCLYIVIIDA
jgi:hypothetical protein